MGGEGGGRVLTKLFQMVVFQFSMLGTLEENFITPRSHSSFFHSFMWMLIYTILYTPKYVSEFLDYIKLLSLSSGIERNGRFCMTLTMQAQERNKMS